MTCCVAFARDGEHLEFRSSVILSDVNKDSGRKAKAKDSSHKAKAKDLTRKAKAKDFKKVSKAKAKDFLKTMTKDKVKDFLTKNIQFKVVSNNVSQRRPAH